jgi:hypothetical protein
MFIVAENIPLNFIELKVVGMAQAVYSLHHWLENEGIVFRSLAGPRDFSHM